MGSELELLVDSICVASANDDALLIVPCDRLRHRLGRFCPTATARGDEAATCGALLVSAGHKRRLVQSLAKCDGPLACHALQGCLAHFVSVAADVESRDDGAGPGELEQWFRAIVEAIVDCLGLAWDTHTAVQHLRCATFLLQLCSSILKSERGSSHPERTDDSLVTSDRTATAGVNAAPSNNKHNSSEILAAQTCAKLVNAHLDGMVRAASALMLGGLDGKAGTACAGEIHWWTDAGFWVLSLVSDVLKHARKRGWTLPNCTATSVAHKQDSDDDVTMPPALHSVERASSKAGGGGGSASASESDCAGHVPDVLDAAGLAEAVSTVPVGNGSGMVDVALKWLEVTQLLMDAAEAMALDVLRVLFKSVPPTLSVLAGGSCSLLPQNEPSRSPGVSFAEEGGAEGTLSQAMLSIVFRIVRVSGQTGLLIAPGAGDVEDLGGSQREGGVGQGGELVGSARWAQSRTNPSWSTAAEALTSTAAAAATGVSSAEGESHVGFAARLVRLFGDQDDALVDMVWINLRIYQTIRPQEDMHGADSGDPEAASAQQSLWHLYRDSLHPAAFFVALLYEVRFDSGVLLDWLISPETSFLPYITLLLRVGVAEWSDFAALVSGASLASLGNNRCSGGPASTINEEGEEEEELVLSEAEAERLDRVMSCLSELLAIARALEMKGLAPYNLAPLLRRIEQIVLLYEDCGDAEEESDTCSDSSGGGDLNGAATLEHADVDISIAQKAEPYGVESCDSSIERSSIV